MSLEQTRSRVLSIPPILSRARAAILGRLRTKADVARSLGPTVEDRQRDLIHFYQEYEILVETLCDSSQYGPQPGLEKRYQAQRAWMEEHYPRIGRYVVAYIRFELEDEIDPFRSLFAAEDLVKFQQMDDGNMISRIMRTREALNLYGDHLRQLASSM